MSSMHPLGLAGVMSFALVSAQIVSGQTLAVSSTSPARNSLANTPTSAIEVVFDRAADRASFARGERVWVSAARATMTFTEIGILDTTQPGISPRPYGVVNSTDVSAFINAWLEDIANACGA